MQGTSSNYVYDWTVNDLSGLLLILIFGLLLVLICSAFFNHFQGKRLERVIETGQQNFAKNLGLSASAVEMTQRIEDLTRELNSYKAILGEDQLKLGKRIIKDSVLLRRPDGVTHEFLSYAAQMPEGIILTNGLVNRYNELENDPECKTTYVYMKGPHTFVCIFTNIDFYNDLLGDRYGWINREGRENHFVRKTVDVRDLSGATLLDFRNWLQGNAVRGKYSYVVEEEYAT